MFDFLVFSEANMDELGSEYQETKNMLKYSFRINLDKSIAALKEKDASINEAFLETYKICDKYKFKADFFSTDPNAEFYNEYSLFCMIQNHCVISSMQTVKTLLHKNETLTITDIGRYSQFLGYYSYNEGLAACKNYKNPQEYLQVKINLILTEQIKVLKQSVQDEQEYSNMKYVNELTGMHAKTLGSMKSTWSKLTKMYNGSHSSDSYDFNTLLHNKKLKVYKTECDFIYFVLNTNLSYQYSAAQNNIISNKGFTSVAVAEKFLNHLNSYDKLIKLSYSSNCHLSKKYGSVDSLLLEYNLERYFCPKLINILCLSASEIIPSKEVNPDLCKVLSKCILLPNAFSRNHLVKAALTYFYQYNIFENYWFPSTNSKNNLINLSNRKYTSSENRSWQWCKLFNYYINYLSYILFPIYEKSFFINLYEAIKSHLGSRTNTTEILLEMEKLLIDFISENYEFLKYDFQSQNDADSYHVSMKEGNNTGDLYYNSFLQHYKLMSKNFNRQAVTSKTFTLEHCKGDPYSIIKRSSSIFSTICSEIYSNKNFSDLYNRKFNLEYFHPDKSKLWERQLKEGKYGQFPDYHIEEKIVQEIVNNRIDFSDL